MDRLKPGMIVKHFKRETTPIKDRDSDYLYLIESIATHTETEEKLVIYRALYGDAERYARPYDMFMDKVDKEKYPDIKQEYRFEAFYLDDWGDNNDN